MENQEMQVKVLILQETIKQLKHQLGESQGALAEANAKVHILNQTLQAREQEVKELQEKKQKKK